MTTPEQDPIVVVGMARTAMGSFQGVLAPMTAPQLGSAAIKGAIERAGVKPDEVSEVLMGCVLPAGIGQAPARQASIFAGVPNTVPCTTVNKMCGSGMKTVMQAYEALHARPTDVIVAGGMESMTNAPYLLPKMRNGARLGHAEVKDHMFLDGLEDAFDKGRLMGSYAEDTAQHYQFTREAQDDYAIASLTRAQNAQNSGAFDREIVAVEISGRKGPTVVDKDEQPAKGDASKIPTLKPAFAKDGTITAANASSISDGAAALVLTRQSVADRLGLKPVARVVSHAAFAHEPAKFTTAPVAAMTKALKLAGWDAAEVDLYEVNEAFACVAMIAMRDLDIPHDKINVHGGATALGHPIGASGARVLATLLSALETHGGRKGVASLCIGGGEATAMAVELVD